MTILLKDDPDPEAFRRPVEAARRKRRFELG
jgi:hypothetical protein